MVFLMDITGHIFWKQRSTLKEQAMQGKEIKQLRHRLDMSQKEFAEKIGITRSFLSKIENGKKKSCVELVEKIRKAFSLEGGFLPMEAKIDFLRIRFKYHSPVEVIEKVLRMSADHFGHKDFGFYHYTATYFFSEIFVYYNPNDLNMGVMIEFRGQGCREFELILEEQKACWTTFFWRLYEENLFGKGLIVDTKITRIDIALDEMVSDLYPNYDLFELKEKWEKRLVDSTFQNFDFRGGEVVKNNQYLNKGLSLYFGSRQSPMYMNFYQKDFELAKKEQISVEMARQKYEVKNRYEVRLADEKAYLFVEYLLSTGESLEWVVKELIDTSIKVYDCDEDGIRTGYSEHWRLVIESMERLHLTMKGQKPSYEKSLRWLSNYLAPTLKKIWIIDQTLGKNELMERIEKAELKDKDIEKIKEITTKIKRLLVEDTDEEVENHKREQIVVTKEEVEELLSQFLF
jgi:phage replication initiation protein